MRPVIEQIKASGATSLRAIAKALNAGARRCLDAPMQVQQSNILKLARIASSCNVKMRFLAFARHYRNLGAG